MLSAALLALAAPGPITLKPGIVIRASGTVKPGVYRLPHADESGKTAAVTIRGDNLTVDFKGATLEGTAPTVDPDQRVGTGVRVQGKNVVIQNLKVRGYKIGLIAVDSPGVKVLDSDLSYNWKQRLKSTLEREDGADWMSFHRNEKDEWLRYGAAIYLRRCDGFEVRGARAIGGQCGLMLTECDKGLVWNSNFSFLSAIGLGMYLSSDNRIMHNRIDWCVRGYSHGRWNRGQDSAGILIYEQSHRNVFAYNSVTHGGDGFFLWAGQTTMDTGKGGCNDNLLYGNDFSHAPTNGIEATFSRNNFVNNKVLECWHGIWGGYSWESKVVGNVFGLNAQAIAWEHGQKNLVESSVFYRDNEGISLWANASQDPNWGYPKNRDTRSVDWRVEGNLFAHIPTTAIRINRTDGLRVDGNEFLANGEVLVAGERDGGIRFEDNTVHAQAAPKLPPQATDRGNAVNVDVKYGPAPRLMHPSGNVILGIDPTTKDYLARFSVPWFPMKRPAESALGNHPMARAAYLASGKAERFAPKPLRGGIDPFIKPSALRGRRYILVDEWGPYDFKRPLLWLRGRHTPSVEEEGRIPPSGRRTVLEFEVLGPPGSWKVVGSRGLQAPRSGKVPATIYAEVSGSANDLLLELEYTGEATTDVRGVATPAGKPVRFRYSEFHVPIAWDVKFYAWSKSKAEPTAPRGDLAYHAMDEVTHHPPLATMKTDRLDLAGAALFKGLPNDHYATVAEGEFEIAPGEYVIEMTTDDGAKLWLDGYELISDAWKYQGPTDYRRTVRLGGKHRLLVEHFQIDGYAALKVGIRRQ